jgi:hypothetical protein
MTALVLAALIATPKTAFVQPAESGPRRVVLSMPQGEIDVYLPRHLVAGSKISGSLFAAPAGQDINEQRTNQQWLDTCTVNLGDQKLHPHSSMFSADLAKDGDNLPITVQDPSGAELSAIRVKFSINPPADRSDFSVQPLVQAGMPLAVFGPFDGDRNTTYADFGKRAVGILAEGPGECYITSPWDHNGVSILHISKNGQKFDQKVSVVSFTFMTPAKATRSGGHISVGVEVDGLQDADPGIFPVVAQLNIDHPNVMRFEGPNADTFQLAINQADIEKGHVLKTVPIKARSKGTYVVTGTIFSAH